jgi:type 1 fimbriae regulatory protein FimB/type 1 fimbriae regulatory protein FimE
MKSLTRDELHRLFDAAEQVSHKDALMLRVTFNHGLRVSEVISLNESNIVGGHLVVQRLKKSRKTTQPLLPDEQELTTMTGRFFPMSRMTFHRRMVEYGRKAGIPEFKCHAHALKHSTGRLAYLGGMKVAELQKYLGHVNGGNTMVYLEADEAEAAAAFAAAVGK